MVGGEAIKDAKLSGAPDIMIMDTKTIIEVKYASTFAPTDCLQVALYQAMAESKYGGKWTAYLLSAKTGQCVKVEPKTENSLMEIMQNLVDYKNDAPLRHGSHQKMKHLSDEAFLEECRTGFKDRVRPLQLEEWYGTLPEKVERCFIF